MIDKETRNRAHYVCQVVRATDSPVAVLLHGERVRCLPLALPRNQVAVDLHAAELVGVYTGAISEDDVAADLLATGGPGLVIL